MQKIGIIGEYNPFHNGHIYHLKKIKDLFPDSFITLILSSNYTQRGEISFLTKWEKTKLALKYQVDLVIELPCIMSSQGADKFAYYAVSMLEILKMDYLIFGSESNDIDTLKNLVTTTMYHKEYPKLLKKYLDLGNNYPTSLAKALFNLTGINLNTSNDLLGLSYLKVILNNNYQIKPLTIKRTSNFKNQIIEGNITSATSIREAYLNNLEYKNTIPKETDELLNINKDYLTTYFNLLKYKIINEINELDKYLDVTEGIDKRIKKYILKVNSYQELIDCIKTKRYTYNRLNRMFLHIFLNLKKEDSNPNINYLRVLGFSQKGRLYLKNIKDKINVPIITNYKDINDFVLKFELKASILYFQIVKKDELLKEELKSIPIKDF